MSEEVKRPSSVHYLSSSWFTNYYTLSRRYPYTNEIDISWYQLYYYNWPNIQTNLSYLIIYSVERNLICLKYL